MEKPLITIVTSTYNAEKTLQRCIDSVFEQTFKSVEHILIDGLSQDGTAQIIEDNVKRKGSRIAYWKSEPDTGIYNAWNKAVPHIRGDWVLFLGADDFLASNDVLEKMSHHLKDALPNYRIVYGKLEIIIEGSEETVEIQGKPWDQHKGKYEMGRISLPGHPEVFQHNSLFNGLNSFDEQFRIAGDSDFLIRELKDRDAKFIPITITKHTMGGVSADCKNITACYDECKAIMAKYGLKVPFMTMIVDWSKVKIKSLLYRCLDKKKANICRDVGRFFFRKKKLWSKLENGQ